MSNAKRDIWIGGAVLALAAIGWFVMIPFGVDVPGSVKIRALSPDFWPKIIMGMLAACGAVILVQGYLSNKSDDHDAPANADGESEEDRIVRYDTGLQTIRVVAAFAVLFAFYALSPILGVVVGCMVLVLAATRVLGVTSWAKSGGLAFLLPTLLYFFFTQVASIPIPLGVLEQLR